MDKPEYEIPCVTKGQRKYRKSLALDGIIELLKQPALKLPDLFI